MYASLEWVVSQAAPIVEMASDTWGHGVVAPGPVHTSFRCSKRICWLMLGVDSSCLCLMHGVDSGLIAWLNAFVITKQ